MGDSSPTSMMFGGIVIASMSFKLKQNYIYLSYIALLVGFFLFIIGIVRYYQERNKY